MAEPADPAAHLVWNKDQRTPARRAPSVDRIVRTAIGIADADGLAAVSMRRVATDLGSGTASLYRYVASRDDLLDLMIDTVHGETEPPRPSGDGRADLAAIAGHLRDTLLRHPWLGPELAGRPALGPNSLRRHDIALAAASELTSDITLAANIVDAVTAYVLGAAGQELAEMQAQRRSGLSEQQWREAVGPYLRGVIAEGAYPHFARRVIDARDSSAAERFAFGLDCVLDGIAAQTARPR
ncbi:TetR/AcrR family transcriptional regulator [Nocardia otitidiscaviarum]|uniref:TetR/AcrR family transcriptional regulator n=1 Tax=Nocardia otitidiscaviarum TaxID=1823 RepID=A0A516NL38_9NOCA|nr:TetR/AcrR family transcriptional regulator C-terminal domain-containing protein [Nocardia otitidiscaviarum]MCP9619152.1 TetR/AcrR family transcriptional regulator C-terminal domain-containing protein [Nocardia otitidiscaviarum]QDP79631.1 TetR/AcrR family transcriptional regulator [Nocardia otitidiscaviarum]